MTEPSAKVICDSISPFGDRLTTMEMVMWRAVLSEFNTHRSHCLAGDSVLTFDLPAGRSRGGRRLHEVRISDFVDRWIHGARRIEANPKRPLDLDRINDEEVYDHPSLAGMVGYAKSALAQACRLGQVVATKDAASRRWMILGSDFKAWRAERPDHTRFDISDRLSGMAIRQFNEDTGEMQTANVAAAMYSGEKPVYQVAASGFYVAGSADHRIKTPDGYTTIGDLHRGDLIIVTRKAKHSEERAGDRYAYVAGQYRSAWQRKQRKRLLSIYGGCEKCGSSLKLAVHHIVPVSVDPSLAYDEGNVALLCGECHKDQHQQQSWDRGGQRLIADIAIVERVGRCGVEATFDLEIAGAFPNFVANGVVVHNSRNSASSRAIPFAKMALRVEADPAMPVVWPAEQRGMQGGEELPEHVKAMAEQLWVLASKDALRRAQQLADLGVHKSLVNRLLEPWLWHTVIASATDEGWANLFRQRCSPLAQPEFLVAAEAAQAAYNDSKPTALDIGQWHLPYVDIEERQALPLEYQKRVSVARCARVSYLSHDGVRDISNDLALYDKLVGADPPHASPLEHVATPDPDGHALGNFHGWEQMRHAVLGS